MSDGGEVEGSRRRRWHLRGAAYSVAVIVAAVAWPLAQFVVINQGEYVPMDRIVLIGAVAAAVALAVTLVVGRRLGSYRRTALCAAAVCVLFFNFNLVFNTDAGTVWGGERVPILQIVLWLVVTAVIVRLVWAASAHPLVRQFGLVFLLIVVATQVIQWEPASSADTAEQAPLPTDLAPFTSTPNIYQFIVDQYPRADVAAAYLDHDNTEFEAALVERGFWVGQQSHSAYPNTMTSLASLFQMDYVATTSADVEAGAEEISRPMLGEARLFQELRAEGYEYYYADSGVENWGRCRGDLVDRCLMSSGAGLLSTDAEETLLRRTPLSMLIPPSNHFTSATDILTSVESLQEEGVEPYFLLAHLWHPHEPLDFEADCSRREEIRVEYTLEEYSQEMHCLNAELLEVIDGIRAVDPTAVIIIQGDHGTRFGLDWEWGYDEWEKADIQQRFAVLDVRLADGCPAPPEGPVSTINTYPWLLACLRGEEPGYLDDRIFWWNYDPTGEVVEVEDPAEVMGGEIEVPDR